jgi:hypothetical protein
MYRVRRFDDGQAARAIAEEAKTYRVETATTEAQKN